MSHTLFDKVWDAHVVKSIEGGTQILYIDRHLIHEVTSPQAFAELAERSIKVLRPDLILATVDHNTATVNQHLRIKDSLSRHQLTTMSTNCKEHKIEVYELGHKYNGIVHVIAPV